GGIFTAVFYNSTSGSSKVLNAVPTDAPSAASYGTPMMFQGLRLMHRQYGSMEWPKLLQGAVQLAREGFSIDRLLGKALKNHEIKIRNSNLRDLFCDPEGKVKLEGSIAGNPKLADFLEKISTVMSSDAFFLPSLTQQLSQDLNLSEAKAFVGDMELRKVELTEPLTVDLEKFVLYGPASPTAGQVVADIIIDLEDTTKAEMTTGTPTVPSKQAIPSGELSPLSMAAVGGYVIAADSSGNILVIATSLNSPFGSGVLSPSTGVLFNDFPGAMASKVSFSASPFVLRLKDGDSVVGITAGGKSSVPFAVAQSVIKKVYFDKSSKEAVEGLMWFLDIGEDGATRTGVYGLPTSSDLFIPLIALVESHAGHVSAFGNLPAFAHSDGY
uniref:Uncharacterized protein n=1 Tax=Latimeria chalumnae TaxID=7897 RepID=H2ZRY6_LATCH